MAMQNRNHIPAKLRNTFSKIHQLINEKRFIRGSFYYLRNKCGKKNCRCAKGEKHISLYIQKNLKVKGKGKIKKALIPKHRWEDVKEMNKRYKVKEKVLKSSHWKWLTNMPPIYSSEIIHRFGHGRWDEQERGFNDLATNCHFNHPYHHHPIALMAMLWIMVADPFLKKNRDCDIILFCPWWHLHNIKKKD